MSRLMLTCVTISTVAMVAVTFFLLFANGGWLLTSRWSLAVFVGLFLAVCVLQASSLARRGRVESASILLLSMVAACACFFAFAATLI